MHPFITVGGLIKRGALHVLGGVGIGVAGGKDTIIPTSAAMAAKEIFVDPHPVENHKRWIVKSVLDWAEWTGGTFLGSFIRGKIQKKG